MKLRLHRGQKEFEAVQVLVPGASGTLYQLYSAPRAWTRACRVSRVVPT